MKHDDRLNRLQVLVDAQLKRRLKVFAASEGKTLREAIESLLRSIPELELNNEHKDDLEE